MGGGEPSYDLAYLVTSVSKGPDGQPEVKAHELFVWDAEARRFVASELAVVGDAGGKR